MEWVGGAAGGPKFPRTRRSEDIFTYAEPSMGLYLCISVSGYLPSVRDETTGASK